MPAKRTYLTVMNEMDKVEASTRLNPQAKRNVLAALQHELDQLTGQQTLGDMTPPASGLEEGKTPGQASTKAAK